MSDVIVKVVSLDGYPGGNEPTARLIIVGPDGGREYVTEAYGDAGYRTIVEKARGLARTLHANLQVEPIGRYLSQVERDRATAPEEA